MIDQPTAEQALEALDELEEVAREGSPFNHYAGPLIRSYIEASIQSAAATTAKPLPEPAGFVRLIGGAQEKIYTAEQMHEHAADVSRNEYRKGFIDGQIDMRAAIASKRDEE